MSSKQEKALDGIKVQEREMDNGHKAAIVWFTGLPGAGKTTLAINLERFLFERGLQVIVLDGDDLRSHINSDLGFSREHRIENIRRIAKIAGLLANAGFVVIVAVISPYRAQREQIRHDYRGLFHEIYVSAPLEICEVRDPKGHYKDARAGKLEEFTGVSAVYEIPLSPELVVDTANVTVEQCSVKLIDYVMQKISSHIPRVNKLAVSK